MSHNLLVFDVPSCRNGKIIQKDLEGLIQFYADTCSQALVGVQSGKSGRLTILKTQQRLLGQKKIQLGIQLCGTNSGYSKDWVQVISEVAEASQGSWRSGSILWVLGMTC